MTNNRSKNIVITRTAEDCRKIALLLNRHGFKFIAAPTLAIDLYTEIKYLPFFDKLLIGEYNWIFLFSKHAVYGLHKILREFGRDLPADLKIAVVGESTAEQLKILLGKDADLIPAKANAATLLAEFNSKYSKQKVLFVLGDKISKADAKILKSQGSEVEELVVYKNLKRPVASNSISKILQADPKELVFLFYSPSAVENLHEDLSINADNFKNSIFVGIGATTAAAIRQRFKVDPLIAESPKEESLIKLLKNL